jgi:G3E family GTPase
MSTVRLILVGGFLGAGKTTTLARLASHYQQQGLRVGMVTNDQAQDLVDTNLLRAQGFAVEEVPGACFCCRFDELISKFGSLEESERPDIILAEPVGSCTDLVATVVQPLKALFADRFIVAPFAVLFKPSHGLKILRNESAGFSPKAAYIFRKQLEEADLVILNRIDELETPQLAELVALLEKEYPQKLVIPVSAKTGAGFEKLVSELESSSDRFGKNILDIDYDIYAEGEAEMGWLNLTVNWESASKMMVDDITLQLLNGLHRELQLQSFEIGHLKIIALEEGGYAVGNVVSNGTEPVLSLASNLSSSKFQLIINARVATDPVQLESLVRQVVEEVASRLECQIKIDHVQSLSPGRPNPTHRYAEAI